MKTTIPTFSPWQFTIFRYLFGAYLIAHFACLLPDAAELFSRNGVLPDPALNFTYPLTPFNPLALVNSPAFAVAFVGVGLLLSVLFTLGWKREWLALLLWFFWACLFNRNNLISNPSIPYIGLLLLLSALVPPGEPLRLDRRRDCDWRMPNMIFITAWVLLALGYTFSGWVKLGSPSWVDGTAMLHLLENPLARTGIFRDLLLASPAPVLTAMTWSVLAAEILFLPACLWARGRAIAWTVLVVMHLGILLVVDFADLSLGMIMIHLFTFDPRWLPQRQQKTRPLVLYDGECGLCNRALRFVADEDRADVLSLASLQGGMGRKIMNQYGIRPEQRDTMILVEGDNVRQRSDAVLRIAGHLGGIWRLALALLLVPRPLRDAVYNFISRNRYRWFGRQSACAMPSPRLQNKLREYD